MYFIETAKITLSEKVFIIDCIEFKISNPLIQCQSLFIIFNIQYTGISRAFLRRSTRAVSILVLGTALVAFATLRSRTWHLFDNRVK